MKTGWKWAAASQRGTAHVQTGERRQDAFRVLAADAGFLVAVACDGAGSACHGGLGAATAARLVSSRAKAWIGAQKSIPTADAIFSWVEEARAVLTAGADRNGGVLSDFATTLALAISDGHSTLTAHIGDGAIVARCQNSTDILSLSWPDSGDFASMTFFLTDAVPRLRIGIIKDHPIDRLALLTDGLERLALNFAETIPHARFFEGLFAPIGQRDAVGRNAVLTAQLATFLDSANVNARTDDDKTLIVAACA